jgi:MYXO-CTERM domain-containing protein
MSSGAGDMSGGSSGGADLSSGGHGGGHGCGCRIAGREPTQPGWMIFAGLIVAVLARRRRNRSTVA